MSFKLIAKSNTPPVGALILAEQIRLEKNINFNITWSDSIQNSGNVQLNSQDGFPVANSENEVARFVARTLDVNLYGGNNALERTEVDSWLSFAIGHISNIKVTDATLDYLNSALVMKTWLAAKRLTIADICIFSALYNKEDLIPEEKYPNINRWFKQMLALPAVKNILPLIRNTIGKNDAASILDKTKTKQTNKKPNQCQEEGKFVDLPGAELGKVVVRFPPEASGYLHIGHAKAALLNQYYADTFKGKLIMRFDDTNPAKENVEFEQAILHDLELLQIKPNRFTHSSDYFNLMLECCESLIKQGKAFVDDTSAEAMKEQRDQKMPSVNRDNSVDKNLNLWEEMKKGTAVGQQCCVRAKIDYQSVNGCMRDPTIYRCKPEPHPRTGTKYKVYPTYDFACPIVDSVEGVTHTLRTTEYHDRDPQFYWFIEALNLRRPYIYEYSRLNMTNTVLSKRKLAWLVSEGYVDSWDDPRFPTVRGILRRGMTVEGLKQFIIAQGSSRAVVFMEWDKIWAFNKKVIDPTAIRYTALSKTNIVPIYVEGVNKGWLTVQNHPKDPTLGTKQVRIGPKIYIEREDAEMLKENQNATFINWGNLYIQKINCENGSVVSLSARLNLDNKDFKNTMKLTWLCADDDEEVNETIRYKLIPCCAVYFDHIISKQVLGKNEDFKNFVAKNTRKEEHMLGEFEMTRIKQGEIIQLQRKGFFRCDVQYAPISYHSCREQCIVLFHIPDGHSISPFTTSVGNRNINPSVKKSNNLEDNLDIVKLHKKIVEQGNKVRELKSNKADKNTIDQEVKTLLALKAEYKAKTNVDWKPETVINETASQSTAFTDGQTLSAKIQEQGDKVRQLKTQKADKKIVDQEVKILLSLKADYKKATGQDWKPIIVNNQTVKPVSNDTAESIANEIKKQGDKIRQLKAEKASKPIIDEEVKTLLKLKADYKNMTGEDWKPNTTINQTAAPKSKDTAESISEKIKQQGDKVRQLKAEKASKSIIDEQVKTLLKLKADYKNVTGQDWKPPPVNHAPVINKSEEELIEKITQQGDKVRKLKTSKAEKSVIDEEVKVLLELKSMYKTTTGQEWKPTASSSTSAPKNKKSGNETKAMEKLSKKQTEKLVKEMQSKDDGKTGTRLGLEAKKGDNLSEWYSQVITKGEMIEYYDVSGCYVLRPWSFAIWDTIKDYIDKEIKKLGVQNCYFPIFVSHAALEREKEHIADFAPEVAWVTKSGDSELAEHIAIRPTSETVMYPAYAKWLKSYRDLPLKLNQWNNVVRWEFKHPQPFLRTREFLWQEGHTAFLTKAEANEEVLVILDIYANVYENLLAIPVVRGRKTEKEKFAGGEYTTTVEAFISASGRAIQGATSHHLGQNFSKMFDIQVESAEEGGEKIFVYQNSWGITTRTIGVMIMVHGDDKGLVLPPRVASIQVVIVPCGITVSTTQEQRQHLLSECSKLEKELVNKGDLRVKGDYRINYSPGWKFNHWELKGVPVRLELGPKDLEKKQVTLVRRDNGEKLTTSRENVYNFVSDLLVKIQTSMFNKAKTELNEHMKQTNDWDEFCTQLDNKHLLLVPFCGEISCEDNIKTDSARENPDDPTAPSMGAKSLCVPFEQPKGAQLETLKCIHNKCKNKPKNFTLFGRSY